MPARELGALPATEPLGGGDRHLEPLLRDDHRHGPWRTRGVRARLHGGWASPASRFGARVALDLLHGRDTEATRLELVRRRPIPFPPEPVRYGEIQATRRALARADERGGRRGPRLRVLDRIGAGFDS